MADFSDESKHFIPNEKLDSLKKIGISLSESRNGKLIFEYEGDLDEELVKNYIENAVGVDFALKQTRKNRAQNKCENDFEIKGELVNSSLEEILSSCSDSLCTDLHFDKKGDKAILRKRIHGILNYAGCLDNDNYLTISNKIKVRAGIDFTEKRLPQDGSFAFKKNGTSVDIRVAVCPLIDGEKIVLRFMNKNNLESLTDLGMAEDDLIQFKEILKKPDGCVIVCGPTNAGKSTSIYAAIEYLNDERINIMTVEDPVERRIKGVCQMQVNEKTGFTFQEGLRAILRSDPEIVSVGEIRNADTAIMAINAALTGHMVFTTVHANDVRGAFYRLKNLGIDFYMMSAGINAIIAQRLVKTLCEKCKCEDGELELDGEKIKIYRAVGCPHCESGYVGRQGVFEIYRMDDELKKILLSADSYEKMDEYFDKCEFTRLKDKAFDMLKHGIINIEDYYLCCS